MPKLQKYLILLIAVALVAVAFAGCTSSAPTTDAPTPTPEIRYVYVAAPPTTQPTPIPHATYPPKTATRDDIGNIYGIKQGNVGYIITNIIGGNYIIRMVVRPGSTEWYYTKYYPDSETVDPTLFRGKFPYWLGLGNPSYMEVK